MISPTFHLKKNVRFLIVTCMRKTINLQQKRKRKRQLMDIMYLLSTMRGSLFYKEAN